MADDLLQIRDLVIEGKAGRDRLPIVKGVNLTLARGEMRV